MEWAVEGDEEPSGFHVYRANGPTLEPFRLTDQPLPGTTSRYDDLTAVSGSARSYWLGVIDRQGKEERFGPVSARRVDTGLITQLFGPRPNPVRESSQIAFTLSKPGPVSLRIHDISGRLVRTLLDEERPAGASSVVWDARSDNGTRATRGIYFVKFVTPEVSASKKVVVK